MLQGVAAGRPGTAMQGFSGVLSAADMEAVVDFVRTTFMGAKAANLDYHSEVNGWQPHGGESAAIPFARGDLALDTPWEALTPAQREGKRLFLATCVSCHDHGRVADPGPAWRAQAISYPRAGYVPGAGLDGISGASPYRLHERAPALPQAGEAERRGEALFQGNCAFCHGADGTGRNWIGSFLERAPRDLTSRRAMAGMSRERLAEVIRTGLPGTSMPAWGAVLSREQIEDLVAYLARAFNTVP
jgi:cytochrome c oxidase cbb3-type subunit 3